MEKTSTDFSQLSKRMFKKSAPVEKIKPLPKTKALGGDDALSYFGLNATETPTGASGGVGAGDGRILALEADVRAVHAASAAAEPVREVRIDGILKPPKTAEVFPGEVREHILAALSEAHEAAESSERDRRATVLGDVLADNKPSGELERRRKELRQIIKDTGSFVDARTIAAMERLGFKYVSGNKHWKIDYANVRIPMSKTPSDHRAALNTATDIANRCF